LSELGGFTMTSSTQPGWYDDPEDSNGQRYWDGQAWTPHRQRKPAAQPSPAPNVPPPQPAPASNVAYPPPAPQPGAWQPPGYPPAGPLPQRSNNLALIIGVIVGVIVLGVGGWFGVTHLFKSHPASPEDQIRNVVQRITDDFNGSKFSHDPAVQCKANAASDDKEAKDGANIKDQAGTLSTSVANIHVNGDSATADVTLNFAKISKSKTQSMQFIKEDGSWKECTPPDSSDDDQSDGDSGN
jgi:Protein of unknown function (DUF2510)